MVRDVIGSIRQAARRLALEPLFTWSAILSLALAIALNTTMFSVLDAMVNPRVDIADPERLYDLRIFASRRVAPSQATVLATLADGQGRVHAGITSYSSGLAVAGYAEYKGRFRELSSRVVAPNYFDVLGVRAAQGRLLGQIDFDEGSRAVVVGEHLVRQIMPEVQTAVGERILVDGVPHTIVGVLGKTADLPGSTTDLWLLPRSSGALRALSNHLIRMIGEGDRSAHERSLMFFAGRVGANGGGTLRDVTLVIRPAVHRQFRFRSFHLAIVGAVVAVLLVACANLANMQLARGLTRARDLAIRVALGASRGALVRHLVLESAVLLGSGLALALVLTLWGMHLVTASLPPSVAEYVLQPQASWRVFAGAALVSCFAIVTIGLVPALRVSRVDPDTLLKSGAGTGRHVNARSRYGVLVSLQIALALGVASAAALLSRAADQAEEIEYGFDTKRVVAGYVRLDTLAAGGRAIVSDRARELETRLASTPHLTALAVVGSRTYEGWQLTAEDPGGRLGEYPMWMSAYAITTPGYFRALGVPILRGRDFRDGERDEAGVIVTQSLARKLWPNSDPIGRRVKLGNARSNLPWLTVVGVAQSFRESRGAPTRAERAEGNPDRASDRLVVLYTGARGAASWQDRIPVVRVLARTESSPERLAVEIQHRLASMPWVDLSLVRPIEQMLGITAMREGQRFVASMFTVFAAFAMSLAALGIYSVVSYAVARRRRELGVRIALGATRVRVLALVLRETNLLVLCGIAGGLVVSALGAHLLDAFLWFEDDPYDAPFYALVALVMFAVATLAALLPARRAAHIDPVEAMRAD